MILRNACIVIICPSLLLLDIFSPAPSLADDRNCRQAKIVLMQVGKHGQSPESAEASYREVIELCPLLREAPYNLGVLLFEKGDFSGAEQAFEKAKALGNDAMVNAALGKVAEKLGNHKAALALFEAAKQLDPGNSEASAGQGAALQNLGKSAEAEKAINESTAGAQGEKSAVDYFNLGLALHGQGKLDEALAAFSMAHELDPKNYEAALELGLLSKQMQRFEAAEKQLEQASEMRPANTAPLVGLLEIYQKQKNAVAAENTLKQLMQLDAKNADYPFQLGELYIDQSKLENALVPLTLATTLNPNHLQAFTLLGWVQVQLKKFDDAENTLKRAVVVNPKDANAHNNLGALYQEKGQAQDAEHEFATATKLDPDSEAAKKNLENIKNDSDAAYRDLSRQTNQSRKSK